MATGTGDDGAFCATRLMISPTPRTSSACLLGPRPLPAVEECHGRRAFRRLPEEARNALLALPSKQLPERIPGKVAAPGADLLTAEFTRGRRRRTGPCGGFASDSLPRLVAMLDEDGSESLACAGVPVARWNPRRPGAGC